VRSRNHWSRESIKYYVFWVCVCSLSYQAGIAHALHCHINGMIFGKALLNTIFLLWFSVQLLSAIFLVRRVIKRDTTVHGHGSSCKVSVIVARCVIKLEFSRQIFENSSNIEFHEHPSSGSRVVPCGLGDGRANARTDGQTDNREEIIVSFLSFANAPKNSIPTSYTTGPLHYYPCRLMMFSDIIAFYSKN